DRIADVRTRYQQAYHRWREVEQTLADLREHAAERLRELEMLRHGLEEIESVEPRAGEDAGLAAEEVRLAHAESLISAAARAADALAADESGATVLVASAQRQLSNAAGHDERLDVLSGRLAETGIELADIASE